MASFEAETDYLLLALALLTRTTVGPVFQPKCNWVGLDRPSRSSAAVQSVFLMPSILVLVLDFDQFPHSLFGFFVPFIPMIY